jgi:hypothetical protein
MTTEPVASSASVGKVNGPDSEQIPTSEQRLKYCLDSAIIWVDYLPQYANSQQLRADVWAIVAGLVGSITGLVVWPLATDPTDFGRWIVSIGAVATAACALFPRVRQYGEMAGQARETGTRYARVLGDLRDVLAAAKDDPAIYDSPAAHRVVDEFQSTKAAKDSLRRLKDKSAIEAAQIKAKSAIEAAKIKAKSDVEAAQIKERQKIERLEHPHPPSAAKPQGPVVEQPKAPEGQGGQANG